MSRQGEKLANVENKLDGMNSTLNQTQRNLNNIKSVFGGIKNWFHGGKGKDDPKYNAAKGKGSASGATSGGGAGGAGSEGGKGEKVQKDTRNHPHMAAGELAPPAAQRPNRDDPYESELHDNFGTLHYTIHCTL